MISDQLARYWYPDSSRSGTVSFYAWVRENIDPSMTILNLGAGPASNEALRILKGQVEKVVGADVDPIVLDNPELDEAVVTDGHRLPFADEYFDLVLSDYVLEHVREPTDFLLEVRRVLKSGGNYFFRTPNIYHYVSVISRMTPHRFHVLTANRIRGLRPEIHHPWPTYYRLNSPGCIRNTAKQAGFRSVDLRMIEAEPTYLTFHWLPFLLGVLYERTVNATERLSIFRVNILGKLTK